MGFLFSEDYRISPPSLSIASIHHCVQYVPVPAESVVSVVLLALNITLSFLSLSPSQSLKTQFPFVILDFLLLFHGEHYCTLKISYLAASVCPTAAIFFISNMLICFQNLLT